MNKTLPLAIALALAGVGAAHAQETPMTNQDTPVTNPMENQVQVVQPAPNQNVEFTSSIAPTVDYGPKPAFKDLDTNGDGVISEKEASAYPPLANDFLHASHGRHVITRAQYERWAAHP